MRRTFVSRNRSLGTDQPGGWVHWVAIGSAALRADLPPQAMGEGAGEGGQGPPVDPQAQGAAVGALLEGGEGTVRREVPRQRRGRWLEQRQHEWRRLTRRGVGGGRGSMPVPHAQMYPSDSQSLGTGGGEL